MTQAEYLLRDAKQSPEAPGTIECPIGLTFDSSVANSNDSAEPNPKPHARYGWRVPARGKKRPGVIALTVKELVRGLEKRAGNLYSRLCHAAPVAGYDRHTRTHLPRRRAWRSDGVESALGMLVALANSSDVRTGFIGRPSPGGGRWQRFGVADLAAFAYQADKNGFRQADDAALKRATRALIVLETLGIITAAAQIRGTTATGQIRSENAVRRLNWTKLAELAGTGWLLARDRQALDKKHGTSAPELATDRTSCAPSARPARPAIERAEINRRGMQHALAALAGIT